MKEFVVTETKKALGRLRKSLVFTLKKFFILVVNLVLWILPLIFLGYLALRPLLFGVASFFDSALEAPQTVYRHENSSKFWKPASDLSEITRLADTLRRIAGSFRSR